MKALITGSSWKIGIAAACSLARKGFTVVGTDDHKLPFNIYSKHLSAHYIHSPFYHDNFYDDIISIIKKEKPEVLLPIGGTKQISFNKDKISKYINILVPDYENYLKVYDKKETHNLCKKVGVSVPNRHTDDEAAFILMNERNKKLVVKPDYDIGGAKGLSIINSIDQLNFAINYNKSISSNYIIEEYIPGASSMRAVQIIFDRKNRVLEYFILKKIRQWPVTGGVTAYAESSNEKKLLDFVMPFFEKCLWEGPVEIELIIDERNGMPKLIEINPRFAGSIAFAIQCGIDFPYTLCSSAINKEKVDVSSTYKSGIFYINFSYYVKAILKEFRSSNSKIAFFFEVLIELKRRKAGMIVDKKDILVYMSKAINEFIHNLFKIKKSFFETYK